MELKEKILEKSAEKIAIMERAAECPEDIREKAIMKRQISKQILEIVCDIQEITPYVAIQILNEAKDTINEVVMSQKI